MDVVIVAAVIVFVCAAMYLTVAALVARASLDSRYRVGARARARPVPHRRLDRGTQAALIGWKVHRQRWNPSKINRH